VQFSIQFYQGSAATYFRCVGGSYTISSGSALQLEFEFNAQLIGHFRQNISERPQTRHSPFLFNNIDGCTGLAVSPYRLYRPILLLWGKYAVTDRDAAFV